MEALIVLALPLLDIAKNSLKIYLVITFSIGLLSALFGCRTGMHIVYRWILDKIFQYLNKKDESPNTNLLSRSNSKFDFNGIGKKKFELSDICFFLTSGFSVIIDDDITKRFRQAPLSLCNLLVRSENYDNTKGLTRTVFWIFGMVFRYGLLLPHRFIITACAFILLFITRLVFPLISHGSRKNSLASAVNQISNQLILKGLGIYPKYHKRKNIPRCGICVSNHTTPLDAVILGADCNLRVTGQMQPGLFGLVENFLLQLGHIFFERQAFQDRNVVVKRLQTHASNRELPPILIFPEGTCINNTCVMMFRKGSFEYSDEIHPVAIKFYPMYGDAFWDSSNESFVKYLFKIITSWMICCDVWYMPSMKRRPGETAADMASRVQIEIANQLKVDALDWDGALKRSPVPESLKKRIKQEFSESLLIPTFEYN